jgi:Fe(3+) dicitrate transport protein
MSPVDAFAGERGDSAARAGRRRRTSRRSPAWRLLLALAAAWAAPATAQEATGADAVQPQGRAQDALRLEEQRVEASRQPEIPRFLPDVKGVDIYAGKKTTAIDPEEPPKIVNDNYRQVLSRTPGLFLSEESTPLVSIGYRGLDPHRTQYTLVLKDGIPIAADMFGYPENYYMPPIDSVEQIDFVHGGASLLYGPQPGGALNFITKKPNPAAPFSLYSNQTFGSDSYYSTYDAASGTVGPLGYYVYYYQKQGLGFREANSDFELYSGSVKTTYSIDDTSRVLVAFDGYNEDHGEPGGLRLTPAPNAVLYEVNRDATSRFFDHFRLKRYVGWGIYENDLSPDTLLRVAAWGGYYSRSSHRQRGGGFGTLPSGEAANTTSIEDQIFQSLGLDARVRHNYDFFGEINTLTAGIEYYFDDSPRVDKRGASPSADNGVIRNKSRRLTNYGSLFAENRFVFGDLALIPAVRLENFSESVDESINVDKTEAGIPLADESKYDFEPLVGFGATYTLHPTVEVYANASSAYRPEIFTQAVPTSPTQIVAGNLKPGTSWQYEVGFRGNPLPWIFWDTSLFWLDFDNQIGVVQISENLSEVRNVGRSRNRGWEASTEIGLLGAYDDVQGTSLVSRFGDLSLFGNVMLLDAKFISGPFEGKTPAYAPDYLVRAGFQYTYRDLAKASLLTTAVAESYANDNNTQDFFIPAYNVWDLTMETDVYRNVVALYAGVNNLFDENYYARIRSDGIDPAYGRNYYGGFKVYF